MTHNLKVASSNLAAANNQAATLIGLAEFQKISGATLVPPSLNSLALVKHAKSNLLG
jgi:hypothetical protein